MFHVLLQRDDDDGGVEPPFAFSGFLSLCHTAETFAASHPREKAVFCSSLQDLVYL